MMSDSPFRLITRTTRAVRKLHVSELLVAGWVLLCLSPESANAENLQPAGDAYEQVLSSKLHLGVGPGHYDGSAGLSGQCLFSTPLGDLIRGLDFEFGVAGIGVADHFQLSFRGIGLRYSFITGSPLIPHASFGIGYYLHLHDVDLDHGMQFLQGGLGLTYLIGESIAIGIGLDASFGNISLKNEGPTYEDGFFTYGLRLTAIL